MRLDRPRLARPALPSKMRLRLAGSDRRPLLADDSGAHWQESDDVEEEDVDAPGFSPGGSGKWKSRSLTKSPRTPTLPATSVKKVKRALGASLPSRRGNDRAKSLKDLCDDDLESRDDESRCLLAGAYEEYYYLDRQGRTNFFAGASGDELSQELGAPVVREPSEEEVRQLQLTPQAYRESPGASSLSSFKQLDREESGAPNVVDLGGFDSSSVGSASDKENYGASGSAGEKTGMGSPKAGTPPPSRLSSLTSDLAGLQISQRSSMLTGSAHNSSVLGYSVDNSSSNASGSPLATPASQQRKTPEQKLYQTPEESVATKATYATSYTQPRQSPCPVAVTATEHGDVILMTPLEDAIDVGPQPETPKASGPGATGAKQALMLPFLSPGTVQDGKAALEPGLKNAGKETPVKEAKRVGFCPQESPTGVDEVFSSEDEFSQVTFSKPPTSTTKEASEFIASEDWSGSEDDENESLATPFGSVTVHQDAFRDLATERAQRSTIELRPSLKSDCEASSSTVAEKSPTKSVQDRSLLDAAVLEEPEEPEEENKEESKGTCARLGSFNQIYSKEGGEELLEEDSDDSESGCYFDLGHDDIDEAEAPAAPRGNEHRSSQKSRPWAHAEGTDDDLSADCVETDLVSLDGSEDDLPLTPNHLLSSETSDSPASTGGSTDESPTPAMDDFDKLNGYWLKEWSAMAAAEPEIETKRASDPNEHQPRFLLIKKDVGNAMGDEDEPEEDAEKNICTDCDGNEYLKIYDLDSGMELYEVLQRSTELETVEECSSEEEEVDAKEEENEVAPAESHSKDLDDLWSKIDEYQASVGHGSNTQPPSSFGSIKYSKKRGVRVKKRAIVKSKSSSKAKFDLAALEKGSYNKEGTHQEKRSHSRTKSRSSLDDLVTDALGSLVRRESGIAKPDEEESDTARRTSINNAELSLLRLMKTEDLKLLKDGSDDGDGSAASSSLSVDSSGDEDSWNMDEGDDEKSGPPEQPVVTASPRPTVQRGASFTLTKLYSENVELAETLASTQAELEKVQRQLEMVMSERDDVVASARFEM
ncbi:hypothetical protein ACHAXT_005488 [Thalassiosira profunda]